MEPVRASIALSICRDGLRAHHDTLSSALVLFATTDGDVDRLSSPFELAGLGGSARGQRDALSHDHPLRELWRGKHPVVVMPVQRPIRPLDGLPGEPGRR